MSMALRQFRLAGRMSHLGLQFLHGRFQPPGLAAQVARTPVHVAQRSRMAPADTELRVRGEAHILAGIVLVHGIDQAHDARMQQVVEGHMLGQPSRGCGVRCTSLAATGSSRSWSGLPADRLTHLLISLSGTHASSSSNAFPANCTCTTGGISPGDNTTTLGKKGSSSRRR